MVYLFHRLEPAFLEAAFTQRVSRGIPISDSLPSSAVFPIHIGATLIAVIATPVFRLMLRAILSVSKPGASGVRTRSLRTAWHIATSFHA